MNPLNHVAIIMDGNGRWGLKHKNSRNEGHRFGLNTVEKIIKETIKQKINYLTLYAFSTENWNRPKKEIDYLFKLLENFLLKKIKDLNKQNIKVYYWDYYLWQTNSFSNLRDETNGQFNDDHWGVEGEKQFLKYMIRRIQDNKQFHNVKPPYYAYKGKYNPQSLI